MSLTADALWLNTTFEGYDHAILSFAHKAAELLGPVLTPLNKLITLLGEKGLLFFLLAVVLMLIPPVSSKPTSCPPPFIIVFIALPPV